MDTKPENLSISIDRLLADLKTILPKELWRANISFSAKIPFKVYALAINLLYRAYDLAEVAQGLIYSDRRVPAMVLSRAVMETTALLFTLNKKLKMVLETCQTKEIDEFLIKCFIGSKHKETDEIKPYNVKTAVKHVSKEHSQYEDIYEWLSEHAHPNSLGADRAYGSYDDDKNHLSFNLKAQEVHPKDGQIALLSTLPILNICFSNIKKSMPEFIKICEAEIKAKSDNK